MAHEKRIYPQREMSMRQIKFRGERLGTHKWVFGFLFQNAVGEWKITYGFREYTVAPETIGQYTGLKDCNGKEIYEGDIITTKGRYPRVVLWDKMGWALMPTEYYNDKYFWVMNLQHPGVDWWEEFADEFEIIGNIYDNPELIKRD